MKRLPITRFGWLCAVLYTSSLLFLLFQGGKTSLMLFVMLNVLALYLLLGRWSGIGSVRGTRKLEESHAGALSFTAGNRLRVKLQIEIPGFWPLPYVIVRERLARASGGECQEYELSFVPDYKRRGTIRYETAPLRRGRYRYQPTLCSTRDIFGLFEHKGSFDNGLDIKVAPRTIAIREWRTMRRSRTGVSQQRVASLWARETTQIDGVREYIHGDRMSRIHWNATARTGQWKSKEYEREALPRFVIVLDAQASSYRTAEGFELAISAAASLLDFALRKGMPVGFVIAGATSRWYGVERHPVNRQDILEQLIDLEAEDGGSLGDTVFETLNRFGTGTHIVVVSPRKDEPLARALEALGASRQAPSQVLVAERNPGPDEAKKAQQWQRLFQANGWELISLSRLEDLPGALEVGTA
ncbi:DUF58 domain-containing protein [Cohnella laeviribosi]|uniref:DUF58 domain-containing protein n=1 Tax=Cohnella laeviribosi TaxID=380174 RepID=UPI00037BB84D|nr:DUF58 domain-containing protein [Cohnella laeviribosi]